MNCGKTAYLRPMRFLMQVHVEVKSMHAKSFDSEIHSLADMAKKTNFKHIEHFLSIFCGTQKKAEAESGGDERL